MVRRKAQGEALRCQKLRWIMKDYLEKRREELSKREEGFTLMEMLIVVAIIAVLIAIAIPIFTSQLENSREATDAANIRGKYAEVTAAALTGAKTSSALPSDITWTSSDGWNATVSLQQQTAGWQNTQLAEGKIGSIKLGDLSSGNQPSPSGKCKVAVNSEGELTLTFTAN